MEGDSPYPEGKERRRRAEETHEELKDTVMIMLGKSREKGFTLIEIVLVVGILGMLSLIFYPDVRRTLEVRALENEARDILTTMQRAKLQAVKTKLNHRVRFFYEGNEWFFQVEREESPGQWSLMPGFIQKTISSSFQVTVDVPSQIVEFSPLGFVTNFNNEHNSITLQSDKLKAYSQPDLRIISVLAGGSIRYQESES